MGVRHLYSFMLEQVPNGTINIGIKDEIEKYKRINNKKPVIIIDLLSFTKFIWGNEKEKLLGGRYNKYNEKLEKVFQSLAEFGADIYFVTDGPLMPEKLPTMLKRRDDRYEISCKIIEEIENGTIQLNDKNLSKKSIENLTPYFRNIRKIGKKYFKVLRSVREGDQDMVYWANQTNALAIISSDTDFLIFESNWRSSWKLWSADHFDPEKLKIIEFNKSALRQYLSLSDQQLILLATLASNDFVKFDMISHFHHRIRVSRRNKFHLLAKIVRETNSLAPNFQKRDVDKLINMMFKPEDREDGLKAFWQSVHFYLDAKDAPHALQDNEIFTHSCFIWEVLHDIPSFVALFYFDIKENNKFTNFYYLIREVFQRQLGIILNGSTENLSSISKKVYVKTEHDKGYYGLDEIPVYPERDIPSLSKLCLTPMEQDKNLDILRKELLCWIVSAKILNLNMLDELPANLVLPMIVILFLLENNEIDVDEADCLLFSLIPSPLNKELCLDHFDKISSPRNFRLSFLFPRLISLIGRSAKILGLKCYDTLLNFDGLVFHYLSSNKADLKNFKIKFDNLRVYKNMK